MRYCSELEFRKVVLKGDALVVIEANKNEEESLALNGQIIDDLKGMLKKSLDWDIKFV